MDAGELIDAFRAASAGGGGDRLDAGLEREPGRVDGEVVEGRILRVDAVEVSDVRVASEVLRGLAPPTERAPVGDGIV